MKLERMFVSAEIRSAGEGEEPRVAGLGIVYDKWTELWPGYKERILKGAAKPAEGEVKSFFNHSPNQPLSTTGSTPPLVLRDTDKGVEYDSPIPPTSYGKDLIINLERKNVRGSSFAFFVPKGGDKYWEDENGVVHREISQLVYGEIGPVTDPAYVTTTASIRSAREAKLDEWRTNQTEPDGDANKQDDKRNDDARLIRHGQLQATI